MEYHEYDHEHYHHLPNHTRHISVSEALERCQEDIWLFHLLEEWAKDNEYITGDYRAYGKHIGFYVGSLFWFHNETMNIWIHALGWILTVAFHIYYGMTYLSDNPSWYTQCCFHVFCLSMETCYGASVIMHTFYPMSKRVSYLLQRIDYVGILCLIAGNISVLVYFTFYDNPVLQKTYYFLLIGSQLISVPVVLTEWFVKHRNVRGMFFTCFTAFVFTPMIHRVVFMDQWSDSLFVAIKYSTVVGLLYLTGGVFYVSRIPERWFPGRFNVLGSSHQWFHLFSVFGGCMMCWLFHVEYQLTANL